MNLHPAAGDCEAIRDGWLAQPANATSSVAFIAVGGWIVLRGLGAPRTERLPAIALGSVVAANGVGGVAFHGPGSGPAHWLHDAALLATAGVVAALGAREYASGARWGDLVGSQSLVAGVVVAGVLSAAWPAGTPALTAALVGLALGWETANAPGRWRRRVASRRPWLVAAGALAVGAGAHLLGRSDSAWCRPESLAQLHALWHVAAAVGIGSWAAAAGWVPRSRSLRTG